MAAHDFANDPTSEEALALFEAVEEKFPSNTLGDDKWYILTVCGAMRSISPTLTSPARHDSGRRATGICSFALQGVDQTTGIQNIWAPTSIDAKSS